MTALHNAAENGNLTKTKASKLVSETQKNFRR